MKFAKEAWPFVLPFVALGIGLFAISQPYWAGAALLVGFFVLLFFRDPKRAYEGDPSVVIAAADGLVTAVEEIEEEILGPGTHRRVVTFLSAFDVHVQRTSVSGEVVSSTLKRGLKVPAFRHDAGEVNEAHTTLIRRSADGSLGEQVAGDLIAIRQISGLMARRVVCYLKAGDQVRQGQHLGVIKFGSRVDLIVPASYEVLVKKGDRLKNGETPMARPAATGS